MIQEEIVEYKVYKEKPYLNSDREPFGLTLNGKTKEYVNAHENLKSMIKKGKQIKVEAGSMKILDVTHNKAIVNAIVEVTVSGVVKGNVELKVYNPSLNKKKGATIEMRKMSDFDNTNVECLKSMITGILDGLLEGMDVEEVLKNDGKFIKKPVSKVTSKPKLFTCDICRWKTKFGTALKAHKTRIHSEGQREKVVILKWMI